MKENAKILKGFPYHPYPHETTDPIKIIKFPDNYEFTSDELRILEARFKKEKSSDVWNNIYGYVIYCCLYRYE